MAGHHRHRPVRAGDALRRGRGGCAPGIPRDRHVAGAAVPRCRRHRLAATTDVKDGADPRPLRCALVARQLRAFGDRTGVGPRLRVRGLLRRRACPPGPDLPRGRPRPGGPGGDGRSLLRLPGSQCEPPPLPRPPADLSRIRGAVEPPRLPRECRGVRVLRAVGQRRRPGGGDRGRRAGGSSARGESRADARRHLAR